MCFSCFSCPSACAYSSFATDASPDACPPQMRSHYMHGARHRERRWSKWEGGADLICDLLRRELALALRHVVAPAQEAACPRLCHVLRVQIRVLHPAGGGDL